MTNSRRRTIFDPNKADWLDGRWSGFGRAEGEARRGETEVELDTLREIGRQITAVPEGFHVHKTIQRFLDNRRKAIESGEGIDWSTAEALAFGSLLKEGITVRLSGQDSERGTFVQRHSVLNDQEDEERYVPLNTISDQAEFEVINSMLSEAAVLGFEYGYSLAEPNALVLWEAQFGDFANGAQVVIDQFISSGERKWLRMSGLVMLLPHGYEGQGPEHSSARLERFLQSCAEDNMQIVNCTTPMNYFHVLRRQMHRKFRKPLIMMTPKSLLRHKRCVSKLEEFGPGSSFHRVLWDDAEVIKDGPIKLQKDAKITSRRHVFRQGLLRSSGRARKARHRRHLPAAHRTALSVPGQGAHQRALALPQCGDGLVPGRAEEHGRLVVHRIQYLEWVLAHIDGQAIPRVRYAGRAAASAATATGLAAKHNQELEPVSFGRAEDRLRLRAGSGFGKARDEWRRKFACPRWANR